MAQRFRVGKPRPALPRLAARYGQLAPSEESRWKKLRPLMIVAAIIIAAVWGGSHWAVGLTEVEDAMFTGFHRAHHHKPKTEAPVAPATTRPDGRLVG